MNQELGTDIQYHKFCAQSEKKTPNGFGAKSDKINFPGAVVLLQLL